MDKLVKRNESDIPDKSQTSKSQKYVNRRTSSNKMQYKQGAAAKNEAEKDEETYNHRDKNQNRPNFDPLEENLSEDLLEKWTFEQNEYKKNLRLFDTEPWQINRTVFDKSLHQNCPVSNEYIRYVAGFDISFIKGTDQACSGLCIFDMSENMELVYKDIDKQLIRMNHPFKSGFLAFREAPFLLEKLEKLKNENPHLYPHCIFIDGNGLLHPRKFGMACHVGYLSNTPTIGVSKKLCQVFGLKNEEKFKNKIKSLLKKGGDYFELLSNEDNPEALGYCYRATDAAPNPIFVSIGNKISPTTCLWLLKLVIRYRVPEPIRIADILTREYLSKCNDCKS